ncbi:MAG: efflux RND transporter periplasmic adaptor subunit [Planctomycetota bacterium]
MPRFLAHGLLALLLLGLGGLAALGILRSAPPAAELDLPGPQPVPVETLVLAPRSVPRPVRLVGTLRAAREVVLAPEVGGRIAKVVEGLGPGEVLEEGATVLSTDVETIEREIDAQRTSSELARARREAASTDVIRAQAALVLARETLAVLEGEEARWKDLVERGRAERARLDLARRQTLAAGLTEEDAAARLASARSAVQIAGLEIQLSEDRLALLQERHEDCRVVAPFTGRFVPMRPGDPAPSVGRVLAPSEAIGLLVDVSSLRLVAEVHEDDVAALRIGAPASALPISRADAALKGQVTAIGARVDPLTRSVVVEARFDDPAGLPAGTSARVTLEGAPLEDALWIDERWIGFRAGKPVAFVVDERDAEGTAYAVARPLDLAPGVYDGGRLVRSGLSAGDEVVTSSIELVGDGAAILPRPAARPAASGARRLGRSDGEPPR